MVEIKEELFQKEFLYPILRDNRLIDRHILNILFGKCSKIERTRPYIIAFIEIENVIAIIMNTEILIIRA